MQFVDTHTHLFTKEFEKDIDLVIQRAKNEGINKFFLPNINVETIEPMLTLCEKYSDCCFPMLGLHPCDVNENFITDLKIIEEWHEKFDFCAVGEIGIDLYWDKTYVEQQKIAFRKQVQLAKKMHLPIVIHVRDSFNEVFEIIDEENNQEFKGIFHCFTGNIEQANHILNYGGFKLGIGGVLTFKNSGLDKTINQIDIDHLVLETDSPYLAPTPFRGKRNESAYVRLVAEKLAEIKNLPLSEIANITSKNALEIFDGK